MKTITKLALLITLFVTMAWPGTAMAKGLLDDEIVFGGTFTLESGETLDGDLFILGGIATLEEDSEVNGDVVLMGGTLEIGGNIDGNVLAIGGFVDLKSSAFVGGDVNVLGAHLEREPGARVGGSVNYNLRGQFPLPFAGGVRVPWVDLRFSPVVDVIGFIFRTFLWAALAVLLVLFLPNQTERTAQAAVSQPVVAGALGFLTVVVAVPLLIVLAITIIMSPVSLLGAVLLVIAWAIGLIALGLEIGRRLTQMLNQNWPPAVSAGMGTFVLILVMNGGKELIPCIGWVIPVMVGTLGLGAVLLTRFGTQAYPPVAGVPAVSVGGAPPDEIAPAPVEAESLEEAPPVEEDEEEGDASSGQEDDDPPGSPAESEEGGE